MLIGMGALAAGSAAGVGTGAFSSMESGSRTTEVQVAEDANSFIGIEGTSRYANGDSKEGGKLALDFTGDVTFGYNGDGVNPGSTYEFDGVFQIHNAIAGRNEDYGDGNSDDEDQLLGKPKVYIEATGFSSDVVIDFYVSDETSGSDTIGKSIKGSDNARRMDDPETWDIGVEIKSTSATSNPAAGGTITVHAEL
jgi:hypothetical protein